MLEETWKSRRGGLGEWEPPHPGDDRDLGLNASPSLPTLGPGPLSGSVHSSGKWR